MPSTLRTVRSARTILAGSTAALLAAGVAAAAPAQAAGWAPTATHGLRLAHATRLGSADPDRALHITVGLTPRNRAALDQLILEQATKGSAHYRRYLTPAQFTAGYGATASAADAVRSYLDARGMQHVSVAPNRLLVTADATVAQAQRAFHTSIVSFRQAGQTVLANITGAEVPTALAPDVTGVLGLSTLGVSARPQAVSPPKLTGYYPKEFNTVYHSAGTSNGKGTSLAVIAEGDLTSTVADLRTAESKQGLPQVPVSLVYAGPKSTDTSGADEWDLDTQTSTGIASAAKQLYIYVASTLSDSDLARALSLFASQDKAQAGSASLGECDLLPRLDGAMATDDAIFAEAAAQGQTFFASSGDTGSSCAVVGSNGVPGSGPTDTEYPASSPYVMGVGGTTLDTTSSDAYQGEIAWNAGGGGISPVESAPKWQAPVLPVNVRGKRGVPDVAFDADPTTGAQIYVGGAPEQIGGTSLASPLALGLWTRLQSSNGNRLGAAGPLLYGYYAATQNGKPTTAVPGFHDVVLGANGVYTALPGYDFTTGLGSWDLAALNTALK